jgi:hypothetical protein
MKPTLPEHAVLLVEPYEGRGIRPGDVVVFRLPGSSGTVVHRTVSFSKKRFVTKGDANEAPDPWVTDPDAVMGKVCYVCAGNGLRRIYGGRLGVWAATAVSLRRSLARVLVPMVRPLLKVIGCRSLITQLWTLACNPKVVNFNQHGESTLFLLAGSRTIGRFEPEQGTWCLRHPFSSFLDVSVLPRPRLPLI